VIRAKSDKRQTNWNGKKKMGGHDYLVVNVTSLRREEKESGRNFPDGSVGGLFRTHERGGRRGRVETLSDMCRRERRSHARRKELKLHRSYKVKWMQNSEGEERRKQIGCIPPGKHAKGGGDSRRTSRGSPAEQPGSEPHWNIRIPNLMKRGPSS